MKVRDEIQRLNELREYLEDVQQACRADAETLRTAGRTVPELDAIRQNALELARGFVLRYGVVGDSNAGKSLLISALIGLGLALPVNPFPETGNITILCVRNDAVDRTHMGPYRLNFFSPAQARECLRRLGEEVGTELDRSRSAALAREARRLVEAAGERLPAREVLNWIGDAWPKLPNGLDVRNRFIELARLCAAWHRYGALVADRYGVEVPHPVAEEAMVLPKDAAAETVGDANPIMSALLTAGGRPPLAELPNPLTVEFARDCYPLVRDVRVEVRVPPGIWDLRAFHVGAIEIFDFPGFRASKTAARDRLLVELALAAEHLHAWLVVVNAADLTGTQASRFLPDPAPNRLLAVANRFDELSLAPDGYLRALEAMVGDAEPKVSQARVVERVRPLEPLTSEFPQLAPLEYTAVVSALLGWPSSTSRPRPATAFSATTSARTGATSCPRAKPPVSAWDGCPRRSSRTRATRRSCRG